MICRKEEPLKGLEINQDNRIEANNRNFFYEIPKNFEKVYKN